VLVFNGRQRETVEADMKGRARMAPSIAGHSHAMQFEVIDGRSRPIT
jgi:hypothetical protein